MREDGRIDYVEMPGGRLPETKRFYADAFGWAFTDYGPDYAAFDEGLDGGFWSNAEDNPEGAKAAMIILFAHDLEAMEAKVRAAGGRRFHFTDPAGNELAVWSED